MDWRKLRKAILRLYAVGFLVAGLALVAATLDADDRLRLVVLLLFGLVCLAEGIGLLFLHWLARFFVPVTFMAGWLISFIAVVMQFSVRDLALAAFFLVLWFFENRFERLDREIFAPSGNPSQPSARR